MDGSAARLEGSATIAPYHRPSRRRCLLELGGRPGRVVRVHGLTRRRRRTSIVPGQGTGHPSDFGRSRSRSGARGGAFSMDLGLKDKVAIVGGASKGLGRACAEVLAEEGFGQVQLHHEHHDPGRRRPRALGAVAIEASARSRRRARSRGRWPSASASATAAGRRGAAVLSPTSSRRDGRPRRPGPARCSRGRRDGCRWRRCRPARRDGGRGSWPSLRDKSRDRRT